MSSFLINISDYFPMSLFIKIALIKIFYFKCNFISKYFISNVILNKNNQKSIVFKNKKYLSFWVNSGINFKFL